MTVAVMSFALGRNGRKHPAERVSRVRQCPTVGGERCSRRLGSASATLALLPRRSGRSLRVASFGEANLALVSVDPVVLVQVLYERILEDVRRLAPDTWTWIMQRQLAKRGE